MSTETNPLVSVIIPTFNSAKFISQTLESLLYQTMKNFEVVVVDDCSTDNSVEVVRSFSNRFNGRLRVFVLSKNTGVSGLPRNFGIKNARGKYIAFLDSDDLFTKTALEEFSTLAEKFQADAVHTNQFFVLWKGIPKSVDEPVFIDIKELTNPDNFQVNYAQIYRPDKPTFETANIAERVQKFLSNGYTGKICTTFFRRDFLINNQVVFPNIRHYADDLVTFKTVCLAKILMVPNINYIVRPRVESLSQKRLNVDSAIHSSLRMFIDSFKAFENIMDEINFFADHPDYRYTVLDWCVKSKLYYLQNIYARIHPAELMPLVEKEFSGDDAAFAAYLFNTVNVQQLQLARLNQELAKFHSR